MTTPTTDASASEPLEQAELRPGRAPFWNVKRVFIMLAAALVLMLSACGCLGVSLSRVFSSEMRSMAEMKPFVQDAYPDYRIADSTRGGYILQHPRYGDLRIDVRFEQAGGLSAWEGPPRERLSGGWSTPETFFRHANGMAKDPRTGMTYDVDGFVEKYVPLRPGPNAVVSAVWLDETTADTETYIVLVARRNRMGSSVENMWPDHLAIFTRDSVTGEWAGTDFKPVEIPRASETR